MLPPRLIRRLVLAPLVIVIAVALVVLFPLLALVALTFGAVGRSRPGRMRVLRLLFFALVWLTAETVALFMCLGLWVASGFGGRLRTEPGPGRGRAACRLREPGALALRLVAAHRHLDHREPAAGRPGSGPVRRARCVRQRGRRMITSRAKDHV